MILNFEKWQRLHEAEMATAGNSVAVQAAKKFYDALIPTGDDNEAAAVAAVQTLKTEADYNAFSAEITKLSKMSVKDFFNDNMSLADKRKYNTIVNHVLTITNNKVNLKDESTWNKIQGFLGDTGYRGPDATE
jgi:hypothetical protein